MSANIVKENLLEIKRFINAPRERVFAAWTRPEEMAKWLRRTNTAHAFPSRRTFRSVANGRSG